MDQLNYTEIGVALIGLVGLLATAALGYFKAISESKRANRAEAEVKFQAAALDFSGFVAEWAALHEDLEKLLTDTCIDRFLILRAWNGSLTPKWTTSIFQMRSGIQKPINYVHFELDTDYVNRLRGVTQNGYLYFRTDESPDSYIKEVYNAEGVKASIWCFLNSMSIPNGPKEAKAIMYCSFATHEDIEIPPETITQCKVIANRLRGIALNFEGE